MTIKAKKSATSDTVIVQLTPEQKKELKPLFGRVNRAHAESEANGHHPDVRVCLIGQAWGNERNNPYPGCAAFRVLSYDQYQIVAKALIRALKLKT